MKVAVVNETSTGNRNADIMEALELIDVDVINAGMTESFKSPELSYVHAGVLTAILLNTGAADFVIGGCSTGQGFLEAAMQFPGVFCGFIKDEIDAWLFAQINGGNCVSLSLNLGYGWVADKNLSFILERLFSVELGSGYPKERKDVQKKFKVLLDSVGEYTFSPFATIIETLPDELLMPVLDFPGVTDLLDINNIKDEALKKIFLKRIK